MVDVHSPGFTPPSYEQVVETYGLEILKAPGDWSIANGDLAMTKDGDIQVGDAVYNALSGLLRRGGSTLPISGSSSTWWRRCGRGGWSWATR